LTAAGYSWSTAPKGNFSELANANWVCTDIEPQHVLPGDPFLLGGPMR